jgi:hypothetical protein
LDKNAAAPRSFAAKENNPKNTDENERKIRQHIQRVRYSQHRSLIREIVVDLWLRPRPGPKPEGNEGDDADKQKDRDAQMLRIEMANGNSVASGSTINQYCRTRQKHEPEASATVFS